MQLKIASEGQWWIWAVLILAGAHRAEGVPSQDCRECPLMAEIAGGDLHVRQKPAYDGRSAQDPEGDPKTVAPRSARIARFAIGIYDVTRDEYTAFVEGTGYKGHESCLVWDGHEWADGGSERNWRDPGFSQSGRDPVVCVGVDDALAYIRWLNFKVRKSGGAPVVNTAGPYRLPTWEEAEFASAGGVTSAYPWGDEPSREHANYGADRCLPCQPAAAGADRWLYTSPVGSLPPNGYGLYDMAGNVWQWTADAAQTSGSGFIARPLESTTFGHVVVHGGSWLSNPEYMQSAEYGLQSRIARITSLGFRVAKSLD